MTFTTFFAPPLPPVRGKHAKRPHAVSLAYECLQSIYSRPLGLLERRGLIRHSSILFTLVP